MTNDALRVLNAVAIATALHLTACSSNTSVKNDDIPTDSASIARGQNIFDKNCIACHSMEHDGIGPPLGGITREVSHDWLIDFIKDPKAAIESGDERAKALFATYKSVMPSFDHYSEDELEGIISYLHTTDGPGKQVASRSDSRPLANPIPERISMSPLVVNMKLVTQMPATHDERPLTRITKLTAHPNTNEFFVLDLRGKLYRLRGDRAEVYLDLQALMPDFINTPGHATGFGSFAFHPEFSRNGLLYTTHTERRGSAPADFSYDDSLDVQLQWVVSEWRTGQPTVFPFAGLRRELFRINMMAQSHGVQEITFNPLAKPGDTDYGLLYVGIGDGGSAERGILDLNKGPENMWSSIVRIDPNGDNSANGNYGIPKSNPFANSSNPRALGEVYAYGFRNPHRITWTKSGMMLASNIGQHNIEELNLILPGHDYGWPTREGSFAINLKGSTRNLYPLSPDDKKYGMDYPVAEYDHDEGNAIIGGYEYQGNQVAELKGKYLFGDMVNGRLFFVDVADIQQGKKTRIKEWRVALDGKPVSFKELCNDERLSMRFGRDHQGEIYISTMPDGKIYKLVP